MDAGLAGALGLATNLPDVPRGGVERRGAALADFALADFAAVVDFAAVAGLAGAGLAVARRARGAGERLGGFCSVMRVAL